MDVRMQVFCNRVQALLLKVSVEKKQEFKKRLFYNQNENTYHTNTMNVINIDVDQCHSGILWYCTRVRNVA